VTGGIRDELRHLAVPLDSLRCHPDNPRRGSLTDIRHSLIRHGQYKPLVAARDGTLLAGNHTWMACRELGWTEVAAVHLDLDPTSDAALRILAVDNATHDKGDYDKESLLGLLRGFAETEDGLDGTGYGDDDLADLIAILDNPDTLDSLADEFGEPKDDDLWPVLRFRVPQHARAGFYDVTEPAGDDDTARFLYLLRQAGWQEERVG
jgi:hypothetical protein